jgi:hypothetical protein
LDKSGCPCAAIIILRSHYYFAQPLLFCAAIIILRSHYYFAQPLLFCAAIFAFVLLSAGEAVATFPLFFAWAQPSA